MGESGPAGYTAGTPPANAYAQFQALNPEDRQPYIDQYMGLSGNQQQGWLDATGQTDPTGGVNNPNYVAPTPPPPPPPKSGGYPTTSVPTNTWTPDPVGGPAPPVPAPNAQEGGNPWDDLTSPRFQAWFNAQLDAGDSPGLNWTGSDPTSPYGSYQSGAEQQGLMAQYNALPPEVQAAYVARYMQLTPPEQAQWRQAFGADPMVGTVAGAASGDPNVSLFGTMADNNQAGVVEDIWAQPWEQKYLKPHTGQNLDPVRDLNPAWVRNFGPDGSGGQMGGIGPDGQPWMWAGGKPPPGFVPKQGPVAPPPLPGRRV